jgi:hypothetical protein
VAAYEVLLLNTAIPQIQAAQTGDTYVVPRDIAFSAALTLSAGTANGVPYLNASKVVTTGSALSFDGTNFFGGTNVYASGRFYAQRSSSSLNLAIAGYTDGTAGAILTGNKGDIVAFGNAGGDGVIFANGNTERARITGTGEFQWKPDGTTQAMTLDASGRLGVGTTSPAAVIHANAAGGGSIRASRSTVSSEYIQMDHDGSDGSLRVSGAYAMIFHTNGGERARITSGGNLNFGNSSADRATTAGTAVINIFNGTAPVGTLANGISLYSSSGEAYVMDAAGNATLFSPHDSETNEWIFKSKHTPSGKVLKIDVEKMLRFINDHFGLDAIHEFTEE